MNPGAFIQGWKQMAPLLRKELLEAWRDRRALIMAVCFSLMFPVMLAGGTTFMVKKQSEDVTKVALLGAERAPLISERLASPNLTVTSVAEGEPRELLAGEYDIVLAFSDDFSRRYQDFRTPQVYLYVNSSESTSGRARRDVQERLGALQQLVVTQRLTARGVAPRTLSPWRVETRDVSTPSSRGALILATVPGLLIMTLFIACLSTAVDSSAGERERLSLEPLLLQPLAGWQIITAKTIAVASLGWLGSLLAIAALVALMPVMPLTELGIQRATTVGSVIAMGLIMLPLALLVAVLQILLALRSHSFKDAQTQLSIFQIAPLVMLMMLDIAQVKLAESWQLLPLVGHQQWLKGLLIGDGVSPVWMLSGSLVTLLLVAVAIMMGARALRRENLLSAS